MKIYVYHKPDGVLFLYWNLLACIVRENIAVSHLALVLLWNSIDVEEWITKRAKFVMTWQISLGNCPFCNNVAMQS